jgi:hypothetical protein
LKSPHQTAAVAITRIATLAVGAALLAACSDGPVIAKVTPVEVWNGGAHDVFTSKLADSLEAAFRASSSFTLSSGKRSGTLIATIPASVRWTTVGDRTELFYSIDFSAVPGEHQLGSASGSCWDDNYAECANKIVKEALVAAGKIK